MKRADINIITCKAFERSAHFATMNLWNEPLRVCVCVCVCVYINILHHFDHRIFIVNLTMRFENAILTFAQTAFHMKCVLK